MNKNELVKHALEQISSIDTEDIELAHRNADEVLCELLVALGFEDVVNAYRDIPKWFA